MSVHTDTRLLDIMKNRRSQRKYRADKPISDAVLDEILATAGCAPSAWNLQHWKFIVVREPDRKERLAKIAYGQRQVAECSALIVVLGDKEADRNAEEAYAEAVKSGKMTQEVKDRILASIEQAYRNIEGVGVSEAILNASLAAMQLMIAAAAEGIDSCPMGGFDREALRRELRIPDRYMPLMLISLGYGTGEVRPSGRFPLSRIVVRETFG